MTRMKNIASTLGLKDFKAVNPHGYTGNSASALDLAKIGAECFKIPLFSKICSTKRLIIKMREVDDEG